MIRGIGPVYAKKLLRAFGEIWRCEIEPLRLEREPLEDRANEILVRETRAAVANRRSSAASLPPRARMSSAMQQAVRDAPIAFMAATTAHAQAQEVMVWHQNSAVKLGFQRNQMVSLRYGPEIHGQPR